MTYRNDTGADDREVRARMMKENLEADRVVGRLKQLMGAVPEKPWCRWNVRAQPAVPHAGFHSVAHVAMSVEAAGELVRRLEEAEATANRLAREFEARNNRDGNAG
jgi:hypothetical protein